MSDEPDDEPVPKLPYGRGLKLDKAMLFRIGATLVLLVLIVVAARPCANATSKFVTDFDEKKGSASEAMPKPGNVDKGPEYEMIGPNMTDEERKAAIDRAKAKAKAKAHAANGSAGSGSAGSGSAGDGSAASGSAGSSAASGSAGSGAN